MDYFRQDSMGICTRCKSLPSLQKSLPQLVLFHLQRNNQNTAPTAKFFTKIDSKLDLPVRATLATFIFVCLCGLLYLASTTAFNSIVNSSVLFLNITYVVPQAILIFRRRCTALPPRYLNLGRFGYFCNIFSVLWIVVLGVFVCLSPTVPLDVNVMGYSSIVLVGLLATVILLSYVMGRKSFEGPTIID